MAEYFKVNDRLESNHDVIAKMFNKYFSSVGPNLANNIPNSIYTPTDFLSNKITKNIFMAPTDPHEVMEIIKTFQNKPSCGHDGISLYTLKNLKEQLAKPIAHIINKSLSEACVPDSLKRAKVTPIYKSKDKQLFDNYRPISLLPSVSKVLEKVVFKRLYLFLDKNAFFHKSQYGFRPNHSTSDAVTEFTNNIYNSLEKNEISIGIFLDLSKAFDSIDLNILLNKLNHCGVRGKALDWFRSYLYNRKQYVNYKGSISNNIILTHGVPQGSILGPLLFLIYVNDLPNALSYSKPVLFADDTNLFASSSSPKTLMNLVNKDLEVLNEWFKANKLTINIAKTFYIIFKRKLTKLPHDLTFKMNDMAIENKESTTFLGITVDSTLSWNKHVEKLGNKISSANYIINKLKYILPKTCLKMLYYSLIHPHLSYGIIHWGKASKANMKRLIVQQKKAIRIINRCHFNTHTDPLFQNSQILKVNEIYELQLGIIMYKHNKSLLPTQLQQLFTLNREIHQYNTRNRNDPIVPKHKLEATKRSIAHMGPIIWNSIPKEIKTAKNLSSFKRNLKSFLINR